MRLVRTHAQRLPKQTKKLKEEAKAEAEEEEKPLSPTRSAGKLGMEVGSLNVGVVSDVESQRAALPKIATLTHADSKLLYLTGQIAGEKI